MKQSVYYLASEELEGRYKLTSGDTLARQYIATFFRNSHISPLLNDYFQEVSMQNEKEGKKVIFSSNVVGFMEGTDELLKNEFVVIGAHFDHLGKGKGFRYGRTFDSLHTHYGADDNASGTAMMLEMAKRLSKVDHRRSIIFIAFAAEELGLLGSKYFVEHCPVDLKQVVAMFNFDMVGKYKNHTLNIGGSKTAIETESMADSIAKQFNVELKFSPSGLGPSDHASFYAQQIPVFFIHTNADTTYHTPYDKAALIYYGGMDTIADYSYTLIKTVVDRAHKLVFQQTKDAENSSPVKMKVSLGIMPDHSETVEGVRVEIVSPNKAAFYAGIVKGDIIVKIGKNKVTQLHDYMQALSEIDKGEEVDAVIIREGKEMLIKIKF
ncbi:MAG: M20/M25/M40 family metallo-hydrolase [Bacteroidales bacterium]|jgi:hypothetical protein|nr:M20/M25/M40 family metallo-hydrolase [Bacteroidales bacterium]